MKKRCLKRVCVYVLSALLCAACLFSCKGNTDESSQSSAPSEPDFSSTPSEPEQSAVSEVSPAPSESETSEPDTSEPEDSAPEVSEPEISEPEVSVPDVSEVKNYVEPTQEELERLIRDACNSWTLYAPILSRQIAHDENSPTSITVSVRDEYESTGIYYPVTDERFDTKAKLSEYLAKLFAEPVAARHVYDLFNPDIDTLPLYTEKDGKLYLCSYSDEYGFPYGYLPDIDTKNPEKPVFINGTIPRMYVTFRRMGSSSYGSSAEYRLHFIYNKNGEWVFNSNVSVDRESELVFWNPVDGSEVEKLAVITPDVSDKELKKLVTDAFSRYADVRQVLNLSLDYDPDKVLEGIEINDGCEGRMCKITDERFDTPEELRNFICSCFSEKSADDFYELLTGDYGWYGDGYFYYVNRDDGSLYMQVRSSEEPFRWFTFLPELTDVSEYSATKLIDGRLQVRIPNADPGSSDSIMTFVYENGEWKLDYYA